MTLYKMISEILFMRCLWLGGTLVLNWTHCVSNTISVNTDHTHTVYLNYSNLIFLNFNVTIISVSHFKFSLLLNATEPHTLYYTTDLFVFSDLRVFLHNLPGLIFVVLRKYALDICLSWSSGLTVCSPELFVKSSYLFFDSPFRLRIS